MIELKKITKDYGEGDNLVHAERGISLAFRDSEFVAILGPSGCGKTTLMNIIGGLDKATSGDILIDGRSTEAFSDADWDNYRNKKIGFVFQSYNLITHLTVLGNVELAMSLSGVSRKERRKRAENALNNVGLLKEKNKLPNQLSGGQQQRVAIARALVNDPEILLADEPTGALDTATSEQVMAIIKKIANRRLVIMVTHNPSLAKEYATRTITMLDGLITADSLPYTAPVSTPATIVNAKKVKTSKEKKSHMSFFEAVSLSGRNLLTKKKRTIMTAVASSIGIIGIALILAVSSGVNNYIGKLTSDTLSSNPITISESSVNFTQAMKATENNTLPSFPDVDKVYVGKTKSLSDYMKTNHITQTYLDYLTSNLDASWYSDILYKTGLSIDAYAIRPDSNNYSLLTTSSSNAYSSLTGSSPWEMLLKNSFIQSQYDVISGSFPEGKDQIALIVDEKNQVSDSTLITLGLLNATDTTTSFNFSDLVGKTYKVCPNDLEYEKSGSAYNLKSPLDIDWEKAETLTITGILRINEATQGGVLATGLAYTKDFYSSLQAKNLTSAIVTDMKNSPGVNPLTGEAYQTTLTKTADEQYEAELRSLGGETLPNEISIYPTNLEAKSKIEATLDAYNAGKDSADMITYTDLSELVGQTLNSVVNVITYVLIGFVAISLVVSSIMVAIITSVSVLERTKEIGILRSIGARKKDVTRVFDAETLLIGTFAGLLGVGIAYLLEIPANLIGSATLGISTIAELNPAYAFLLVFVSVILTVLSGLVPAVKAAKLDPVEALRTE